jgi:hypothetical protein
MALPTRRMLHDVTPISLRAKTCDTDIFQCTEYLTKYEENYFLSISLNNFALNWIHLAQDRVH